MKIAVMQPYFFPYIGYWKLISEVDRFVIFDDVSYINRGWINRNRILINGEPSYITVPLINASQNRKICEIELVSNKIWRDKILKTIEMNYKKASAFSEVFPVLQALICYDTNNLSNYLAYQIESISRYIGLSAQFVRSSEIYNSNYMVGERRIIDICEREKADLYFNLPGGKLIYNEKSFVERGIGLRFIPEVQKEYKQRAKIFIPYMSIIDILMELGSAGIQPYLRAGINNNIRID